jgi:hypothetical protein
MKASVMSQGAREGFVQTEDDKVSSRRAMWDAWAAKFAMGVKAGLGPTHAAEVLRIVGHSVAEDVSEKDSHPNTSEQLAARQASRKSAYARRTLLLTDRQEVQSLKPVRSLADMTEEAWRMDREWKERNLGLPKGLSTYGDGGRRGWVDVVRGRSFVFKVFLQRMEPSLLATCERRKAHSNLISRTYTYMYIPYVHINHIATHVHQAVRSVLLPGRARRPPTAAS